MDKKEILDFLRNQQKYREIDAKINGVNIWVLIGALAFIVWKFLGLNVFDVQFKTYLVVLNCCSILYFIYMLIDNKFNSNIKDIRVQIFNFSDSTPPFPEVLKVTILFFPSFLYYYSYGFNLALLLIFSFCISFFIMTLFCFLSKLFPMPPKGKRIPKISEIKTSKSHSTFLKMTSVVVLILLMSLIKEFGEFWLSINSTYNSDVIKNCALVSAIYFIGISIVDRKIFNDNIHWTYKLETELVLDLVTVETAYRSVEIRFYGEKIQEVLISFFDDIENNLKKLEGITERSQQELININNIPEDYKIERQGRIKTLIEEPTARIEELQNDLNKLKELINNIENQEGESAKIVASLRNYCDSYADRLRKCADLLKTIQ